MTRKILLSVLLVAILSSASLASSPVPPSKGQWGLPLEEYIMLYSKANHGASNQEMEAPSEWLSVPSATRDSDNYLWYSVNINGRKGWLPQNGIRLKMGGKSKIAANIYKTYAKARSRIITTPKGWNETEYDDGIRGYSYDEDTEIIIRRRGKNIDDISFTTNDPRLCERMLGVDLIGLSQPNLRKKLGTPTTRESPYDDIDKSILCYEIADGNMTLAVTLQRNEYDTDGTVISVELYRGRAGEPEDF